MATPTLAPTLRGVLAVLCTPFDGSGRLDEYSVARLVAHCVDHGADAVVCFGLAGETYKLTDEERATVLRVAVEAASGAVPVVAGCDHTGTAAARERAHRAVNAGAAALMAFPPSFVRPDPDGVVDFYRELATAGVPIVVQDAPSWTNVALPVDLLTAVAEASSHARIVKIEAPPSGPKIEAVRRQGLETIAGYGGLHLPEELASGVVGVMPGCATPRLFRAVWDMHAEGRPDEAFALHARALPFLGYCMQSLDLFVAVQKLLLVRDGVIRHPTVREPAPGARLSEAQMSFLESLLGRCEIAAWRR